MQDLFDSTYPSLDVQILGVNEDGHQSQNTVMTAEGDLPWLQDLDTNDNGASDVWAELWNVTYRDVQIVDRNGDHVDTYNVTSNDLNVAANFNTLRDKFIDVAAVWRNKIEPLDVNGRDGITPLDALNGINALNAGLGGKLAGVPGEGDFRHDVTGDGELSPLDPLRVINHLNNNPSRAAMSSPAVVEDASIPADLAFASYGDDADDDEEENG